MEIEEDEASKRELTVTGTKDKLIADSFVQRLPVPIEEKRYYRNSIAECLKRKPWYTKFHNYLELKYENLRSFFDFWRETLAAVEGQHGAAVVAYFVFLRWLLYMNIIIFLLNFCFIVMPELVLTRIDIINATKNASQLAIEDNAIQLHSFDTIESTYNLNADDHIGHDHENITNTTSIDVIIEHCRGIYSEMIANDTRSGFLVFLQHVFQGTGPLELTLLFTGYYPPFNISIFGRLYNVPFAFLCVLSAVFIICIIMMVCYSSIGIQEAFVNRDKHPYYYTNEIFSAWDYGIKEEKSAEQQHYRVVLQMKTNLYEDRAKRESTTWPTRMWLKLYGIRLVINLFVVLWLVGCLYLIYQVVLYQLEEVHKHRLSDPGLRTLLIQFLPSLTIVVLNGISPTMFDILVAFEEYPAQTAVNLSLIRNVFLYLSSIIVLMNGIHREVNCRPKDLCGVGLDESCPSPRCWETYVGQQLFKLTITDMFVYFGVLLFYDLVQYFITHTFDNALTRFWGHPIFFLPTEVLAPIYSQTILCSRLWSSVIQQNTLTVPQDSTLHL